MKNNKNAGPGAPSVSAAEFVRSFSQNRERAAREPVFISHHGRDTHVMLGIEQYEDLTARSGDGSSNSGLHLDGLSELARWVELAVIITDKQFNVVFSNRIAQAVSGYSSAHLLDRELTVAMPEIRKSLFETQARRTLNTREPAVVEFPSPFNGEAWIRLQTAPVGDYLVLIFRDISDDVTRYRLADVKAALIDALDAHGAVGYVRVSLRGTIERVDQPFSEMLGLAQDRLLGLSILDLVARESRAAFRSELDAILTHGEPRRIEVDLISNRVPALPVKIGLASLHGTYGSEGAVLIVTLR